MPSLLSERLKKLEARLPEPQKPRRTIRVIIKEGDEERLLAAHRFNPDDGDFAIIRRIVRPRHSMSNTTASEK